MQENILDLKELESEQVPKAKLWNRLLAWTIDVLLYSLVIKVLEFITDQNDVLTMLPFILWLSYKIYMEYKYGATVGKMIFMIRIVTTDVKTLSITQVLLRNFLDIAASLIDILVIYHVIPSQDVFVEYVLVLPIHYAVFVCIFFIDIIVVLSSSNKQALHDLIAKTVVIQKVLKK